MLYIYLSELNFERQTLSPVLRNLLKQVVGMLDNVPAYISKMYNYCEATGSNPDRFTLTENLKTCLTRFDTV